MSTLARLQARRAELERQLGANPAADVRDEIQLELTRLEIALDLLTSPRRDGASPANNDLTD